MSRNKPNPTAPVETNDEAPTGIVIESNDTHVGLTVEDNTDAVVAEVKPVEVETIELLNGLFQENFA
jgi:hypothetical protein